MLMLYSKEIMREIVIDHMKNPRNQGKNSSYQKAVVKNPACGDIITLYLKRRENKIDDVRYEVTGCALSMASASIMSELIKNKDINDVLKIADNFYRMLNNENYEKKILKDANALSSVSKTPARIKCVTLPYKALFEILGVNNERF